MAKQDFIDYLEDPGPDEVPLTNALRALVNQSVWDTYQGIWFNGATVLENQTWTYAGQIWLAPANASALPPSEDEGWAPVFTMDADAVFPAYLSILSSAKGGNIDMALFKQSGGWLDLSGTNGSEAVTDAAWADAYDAAVDFRGGNGNKGAVIELPAGLLRIDTTMRVTDSRIRVMGQGHGATMIMTDRFDIDMVSIEGAAGAGAVVQDSDISGVSLVRTGTMTYAGAASPKQLAIRNATRGRYDDIFIQKAMNGIYMDRAYDNLISRLYINNAGNDVEAHASIWHTSENGRAGVSFSNYIHEFEIVYGKAGVDAGVTHGIRIDCADGFYMRSGHIISARNNITFMPDNEPVVRAKLGGVFIQGFYSDVCFENGFLFAGASDIYGRIFIRDSRVSSAGKNGMRFENLVPIDQLEVISTPFYLNRERGFYMVPGASNVRLNKLMLANSAFVTNNMDNIVGGGDMILNHLEDHNIHNCPVTGGGSNGTGLYIGATVGPGRIFDNDLSRSTSGTKLSINGDVNGRTIQRNKEFQDGFSDYDRSGKVQTTTTTATAVWSMAVAEDCTVEVDFTARVSGISKAKAASLRRVAIYNRPTGGVLVEEGDVSVWEAEDDAGFGLDIIVTSNSISARVVGLASVTLNWEWSIKYKVRLA